MSDTACSHRHRQIVNTGATMPHLLCFRRVHLAHAEFRAAWDSCNAGAVVKHMDVEALEVFPMLYTQETVGAWDVQTVKCQVGGYNPGDYWSWKHWRDTLEDVLRV